MEAPAAGTKNGLGPDPGRRQLVLRGLQWLAALAGAVLLYPLLRFTAFRVPAKPRLIEVPAPLPLSGVHTGQDFILFAGADGPIAVSRVCTHLGCRINYQQDKGYIECPCHQSRFTPTGVRIAGPAERNLPTYTVTAKKDGDGRVSSYLVEL